MSSQTIASWSGATQRLVPLPWRRMGWVIWRQHRIALAGVLTVFGAAAVYLLITGLPMHNAYEAVASCRPVSSGACQQVSQNFLASNVHDVLVGAGLMQAIPVLAGAFLGVPVLAREFETGTFRFAWTQGFGRTRWTIAKLTALATCVTIVAAAFGALFAWYYQPIGAAGGGDSGPLSATIFDLRGASLPAWTLAAFAIGALAGILIRRVNTALFATLTIWVALAVLTAVYLRPHYVAALVTHNANRPADGLVINQGLFKDHRPATVDMVNQSLRSVDIRAVSPTVFEPGPSTPPNFEDPVKYLIQHGYTQITTYQPASRFWAFQWIEGTWLLVLSLVLMTTTVWRVRVRAT